MRRKRCSEHSFFSVITVHTRDDIKPNYKIYKDSLSLSYQKHCTDGKHSLVAAFSFLFLLKQIQSVSVNSMKERTKYLDNN